MTESTVLIMIAIVWTHFIADFLLQTKQMAELKSSSNVMLGFHAFVYACPFIWVGIQYAIINGVLHFIVDWITSRQTSRLWLERKVRLFFIVIGFDQAIHLTCLFSLYFLMKGGM